jgi:hypothetical protein
VRPLRHSRPDRHAERHLDPHGSTQNPGLRHHDEIHPTFMNPLLYNHVILCVRFYVMMCFFAFPLHWLVCVFGFSFLILPYGKETVSVLYIVVHGVAAFLISKVQCVLVQYIPPKICTLALFWI